MARPLLTFDWVHPVLVNYRVPPALLERYVPPGSHLDTPDDAPDLHLVSLVALQYQNMRALGIPLPTAQPFGGINLRFYVRCGDARAAVFLRQFAPRPSVILGARLTYHQPYRFALIEHVVESTAETVRLHVRFAYRGHRGTITLRAPNAPAVPASTSQEHFIKEKHWGCSRGWRGGSFRFRVDHPVWPIYPIEEYAVTIDPGAIMGGDWRAIDWSAALHSVVWATGSAAAIYPPESVAAKGAAASPV